MAVHKLFDGPLGSSSCCLGMPRYPSVDQPNYEPWAVDWRKVHNSASLTRMLDWGCSKATGCVACNDGAEDLDLQRYMRDNPIAVGDTIEVFGLPMSGILEGICWEVWDGCPGFAFDIEVRGLAGSSVPAKVTVGTVNGAAPGNGYFHLAVPIYLNHNDMLQIKVNGLCPATTGSCGPCGQVHLPPVMVSGFYRACCR
jgi:hypothetical protein